MENEKNNIPTMPDEVSTLTETEVMYSETAETTDSNEMTPSSKRPVTAWGVICIIFAVLACIVAGILLFMAFNGYDTTSEIDITSMESFVVTYYPDPEKNDYCKIEADFPTGDITIKTWTEATHYADVSDVSSADGPNHTVVMQEESQMFRGRDMTLLEEFFIEYDESLLVDDYTYDISEIGDHKIICDMTIQTGDHNYYHMEWLTTLPPEWTTFIEAVQRTTGTVLNI